MGHITGRCQTYYISYNIGGLIYVAAILADALADLRAIGRLRISPDRNGKRALSGWLALVNPVLKVLKGFIAVFPEQACPA